MRYPTTLKSICFSLLVLIGIADYLFYDAPYGCSIALFYTLLIGIIWAQTPAKRRREKQSYLALSLVVGIAGALLFNPSESAIVIALVSVAILAIVAKVGWHAELIVWWQRIARFYPAAATQLWRDSNRLKLFKESGHTKAPKASTRDFEKKWLLPIAITSVFLGLFIIANPLLSEWIGNVFEALGKKLNEVSWPNLERIFIWVATACLGWGLYRYRPNAIGRQGPQELSTKSIVDRVTTDTVIRSLILLNVLFLFMNLLDLNYLWAGATLPNNMTYAEYAQRGAYPLVISALLAGAFVLYCFRPNGSAEQSKLARNLVALWVGQNIFLTVSAAIRLGKYIDIYSMTRLRMAAAIWMALVACGLLLITLRIFTQKDNRWLIRQNSITIGVLLYICAFINFDGYIARYNVDSCREVTGEGAPLDLNYLSSLGEEALPALSRLHSIEKMPRDFRLELQRTEVKLERALRYQRSNWRGWTILRAQLPK